MRWSDRLREMLNGLTPRQAAAIPRIVAHRAAGGALSDLLSGGPARPGKPGAGEALCAWNTYYKRGGWRSREDFAAALALAQEEYDAEFAERALDTAVRYLKTGTARAARFLLQEVELGLHDQEGWDEEELGIAERGLLLLARNGSEAVQLRAWQQLARIAGDRRTQALRAGLGLMDRADIATAVKSTGRDEERWEALLRGLRGDEDGEVADVGAEAAHFPGGGV